MRSPQGLKEGRVAVAVDGIENHAGLRACDRVDDAGEVARAQGACASPTISPPIASVTCRMIALAVWGNT